MSEAGSGSGTAVGRWLTSRKNLCGSAGALVGVGLAFADVSSWPLVAVGLQPVARPFVSTEKRTLTVP